MSSGLRAQMKCQSVAKFSFFNITLIPTMHLCLMELTKAFYNASLLLMRYVHDL